MEGLETHRLHGSVTLLPASAPALRSRPDTSSANAAEALDLPSALAASFHASRLPQILISPYDNRLLAANNAACALFDLDPQTLAARRATDLFPECLGHLHVATQAALHHGFAWTRHLSIASGTPTGTTDDSHDTDSSTFPAAPKSSFEVELVACRTAACVVLHMTFHDLDARRRRTIDDEAERMQRGGLEEWRRAERFFRELEQRHLLILSGAGEGIYGVDANGITTFVNPAAERMLGWRADDLIGREMHQVVHYKHADGSPYPERDCPIYGAFRSKSMTTVDDEVFWTKEGRPVRVEYTSTPIVQDGEAIGAVVVFRDITERKESEARLRRALDENAALRERLEKENAYLQEEILTQSNHHEILGASEATLRVLRQIEVVAATDANVLVVGESGTGKELVAGAIHQASRRRDRPMIRVNCAAIPRELFESEFFGHAKGSFSGAIRDRVGRFELADGGTLFLDEVGEIPLDLQSKLLRVLQESRFERVGEEKTREVDVRLIAATNRDLKGEVARGRFREDLYFRLNVFPIECAPLRQRVEDIPLLAQHFLRVACRRSNINEPRLTRADVEALQRYAWPGNARELQNVMERAAILSRNGRLALNLPGQEASRSAVNRCCEPEHDRATAGRVLTAAEMTALEIENLRTALKASGGRVSGTAGAAELLGMNPQTLYSRLRKLKLHAEP